MSSTLASGHQSATPRLTSCATPNVTRCAHRRAGRQNGSADVQATVNRRRPRARRRFSTARPPRLDIRLRNPCSRLRGIRFGWYVRFGIKIPQHITGHTSPIDEECRTSRTQYTSATIEPRVVWAAQLCGPWLPEFRFIRAIHRLIRRPGLDRVLHIRSCRPEI